MKLLFVNACVREGSRTRRLAEYLLAKFDVDVKEVNLAKMNLLPMNEGFLKKRFEYIARKDFSDQMFDLAKDFASADVIVVAAPYWDMSFSSLLKVYIEHVNVSKIVFDFSTKGEMVKLCKAEKLYYVTTEGGFGPDDFGFGYVKGLCEKLYGIRDVKMIKAMGLDIKGSDVEAILNKAKQEIDEMMR